MQLVFGNGSDELIALLIAAFAGPVLYPVPTFVYYRLAAIARGVHRRSKCPTGRRFELDEDTIERAIAEIGRASCSSRCRTTRPARCGAWTSRSSSRRATATS